MRENYGLRLNYAEYSNQ